MERGNFADPWFGVELICEMRKNTCSFIYEAHVSF